MSDYYYGQGKLYLARRNSAGQALSWRWVGDVSALNIELEFEEKKSRTSVGGRLVNSQRYITALGGKITSTWHDFSAENLQILLDTRNLSQPPDVYAQETLPEGIEAGDRITLRNQNVWGVSIENMNDGDDYIVDNLWGGITFFITPEDQPVIVNYQHAASTVLPLAESISEEFSLRYEGINLAENNQPVLVEVYRVSLDPVATLTLINTETELSGLETTANILYDGQKSNDELLSRLGRIVLFNRLSGITHNGAIRYNGVYKHRG
ncbi:hypothetical protein [Klebsiella pneumoniae]|uniref:phage tail tube protein n=1 Tax=Klebsiella pneumoniae TaxID=573 RepID=UPI0015E97CDB|nr:hypothetical protein [Klebsiella pneumoniae]QLU40539.1 hypothetical protein HV227_13400 [Klebsiella pneumoniae]HBY4322770.1 hypothetical protein [Klebsiella pneumoniae]